MSDVQPRPLMPQTKPCAGGVPGAGGQEGGQVVMSSSRQRTTPNVDSRESAASVDVNRCGTTI